MNSRVRLVFTDTNALVAMLCFPATTGKPLPLAHEVAAAVRAGSCELLVSDIVADELREVVARNFPRQTKLIDRFLERYGVTPLPEPDPSVWEEAKKICRDPDDAPILAAAVVSARLYGSGYLLSNDIATFHSQR